MTMACYSGNPFIRSLLSVDHSRLSSISGRININGVPGGLGFPNYGVPLLKEGGLKAVHIFECSNDRDRKLSPNSNHAATKEHKKRGKKEHHLWKKRDSSGSGQKALNLVRIVSEIPNEKEAVYGALDEWTAWEAEFPLIAASQALRILQKRRQWTRLIQVAKWMLSRGQGMTMGTYDLLLLALDMDRRVDEAESLWNEILRVHTRSVSKRLYSRMIALCDHHHMPEKIIDVFADMEELGVKPDEDTVRRVSNAFGKLGLEEKQKLVIKKYQSKWKYIHFNGERVRVRTNSWSG